MLDNILLEVDIEIGDKVYTFAEGFYITVRCSKFAGKKENKAQIAIANIKEDLRNKILLESSSFAKNRAKKHITVRAGQESFGMETIFYGDITAPIKVSQPPDIILSIDADTLSSAKFKTHSSSRNGAIKVSRLSKDIATELGLSIKFMAKDTDVVNFHHVGAQNTLIHALADASGKDVFVDNKTLVVKEKHQSIGGAVLCSENSGMVGVPEITEHGVIVTMQFLTTFRLGGQIAVKSALNPALDGNYNVFKIDYDLNSRGNFLVKLEGKRV